MYVPVNVITMESSGQTVITINLILTYILYIFENLRIIFIRIKLYVKKKKMVPVYFKSD